MYLSLLMMFFIYESFQINSLFFSKYYNECQCDESPTKFEYVRPTIDPNPTPITTTYEEFFEKFKTSRALKNMKKSQYRKEVYEKNVKKINKHNQNQERTYDMGLNQFAALDEQQFLDTYAKLQDPPRKPLAVDYQREPDFENDLEDTLHVNYTCCAGIVRHQGQCGACYAFSTADTVATIKTLYSSIALPHFPLAPQELVSHSHIDTFGCDGGTFNGSYSYIKSYGINYEMNYEYKNEHSTSAIPGVLPLAAWKVAPNEISSWDFIAPNCASLLHILKKKPVTVAVSALEMQLYAKGTLSGAGGALNHGVMVVGYHHESGFWVKNSWGVLWSSYGGYAWFSKEQDDNLGLCEYGVNIQMDIEQGQPRLCC